MGRRNDKMYYFSRCRPLRPVASGSADEVLAALGYNSKVFTQYCARPEIIAPRGGAVPASDLADLLRHVRNPQTARWRSLFR